MRSLAIACATVLATACAFASLKAAVAYAAADVSFTLDNGLKVILAPQPGNPVVSARIAVKAGSAYESGKAEQGLAHLMEHMAFKGTAKRKVGEISTEVESNGGVINAYTSFDETVYYVALPSDKLETAVDVLSDLVFHPTYDPGEYAKEKEVVIEEIRRADDNPQNGLFNALFADSFGKDHPYGHPILGSAETVAAAGRDTAFAFHEKFYRPDNCVLIITGGFDPDKAAALAHKYLDDVKRPAEALELAPVPPVVRDGPEIREIRNPKALVPKVILGFTCPSSRDSDSPEAELFSAVVSGGDSSRLVEVVRDKLALATTVLTYPMTLKDSGVFLVVYETTPEKIVPAFEAIVGELNRMGAEPPAADEIARARALAAKSFVSRQEAPTSLGAHIGSFELSYGDYRLKDAFLDFWARMDATDLTRLGARTFVPDNVSVSVLLPQDAPELDLDALKASALKLGPPAPPAAAEGGELAFEAATLKSGAKLFVLRDATLPLVEVKAALMGGRLAEKAGQEGAVSLASAVWARASESLAAPEMARAVEDLGAYVGGYSGRNTVGLDGSFLSSTWKEALGLFAQVLTAPAFSQQDFDVRKAEHVTYLKDLDESLSERVFRMARRELYRNHPYGIEYHGTLESVERLTREDIEAIYRDLVRPESLVFAVAGDVNAQDAAKAIDDALEGWNPAAGSPVPSVPPAPQPLSGPVMVSEALDREQTHLLVSFLAPGMGDRDEAALEVLNSALSGMGGILFSELRDKRSLAYTVTSSYGPGLGTGSFNFYIGCAPDKAGEALSGILEIIRAARDKAYPKDTIESAKAYLAGTNKLQRQTLGSRVNDSALFDLYALGQDRNERLLEQIAAVTPEDVKRVAETYLKLDALILSVVGTQASIDAVDLVYADLKKD
ncbi:MAG: insulinase family protein [Deltaproteobacteria bacterium]|jgi:zinc protease|nr:insulinase family protein [Deltaproteobacteria bacterium]